jgi:hypothetical protein
MLREILRLNAVNRWHIGILGNLPQLVVVQNQMRNVPSAVIPSWGPASATATECYCIDPSKADGGDAA